MVVTCNSELLSDDWTREVNLLTVLVNSFGTQKKHDSFVLCLKFRWTVIVDKHHYASHYRGKGNVE